MWDESRMIPYKYTVIYADGRKRHCGDIYTSSYQASDDEYFKIVKGISEGLDLMEIEGIDDVRQKMIADVRSFDVHWNLSGSLRETPLKKKREIMDVQLYMDPYERSRIRKMKDLIEELGRPEQAMTVYRSDGSFVKFTYKGGKVRYEDSRDKGRIGSATADWFIRNATGK